MSNLLRVAAAVIFHDNQVLACRRRADKSAGGLWEFPGGKIEAGESAKEAALREIAEELSTEIRVLGELTTDDTQVGDVTIRLTCLRAELIGPRPQSSTDHDRLNWFDTKDLASLDWATPDLPAVALLTSSLTQPSTE